MIDYTHSIVILTAGIATQGATNFGWLAASAPDMNGDSIRDVLVAAPTRPAGSPREPGSVYLLSGADLRDVLDVIRGPAGFGLTITPTADLDADGLPDFLVGTSQDGLWQLFLKATGASIRKLRGGEDRGWASQPSSLVSDPRRPFFIATCWSEDREAYYPPRLLSVIDASTGSELWRQSLDASQCIIGDPIWMSVDESAPESKLITLEGSLHRDARPGSYSIVEHAPSTGNMLRRIVIDGKHSTMGTSPDLRVWGLSTDCLALSSPAQNWKGPCLIEISTLRGGGLLVMSQFHSPASVHPDSVVALAGSPGALADRVLVAGPMDSLTGADGVVAAFDKTSGVMSASFSAGTPFVRRAFLIHDLNSDRVNEILVSIIPNTWLSTAQPALFIVDGRTLSTIDTISEEIVRKAAGAIDR